MNEASAHERNKPSRMTLCNNSDTNHCEEPMKSLPIFLLFILWAAYALPLDAQELHDTPPPLLFREDWRETPPETPVTQEHVNTPGLVMTLHGPGKDMIKKSHHDTPLDDPYYIWSGQCEQGTWAVTLEKRGALSDLTRGSVRWRTKNYDRILYVVLGLENGGWLVSSRGAGETPDWQEFTIDFRNVQWRRLDIEQVTAGEIVKNPDLTRVRAVGFTDLELGGQSVSSSRLDWIEVYGRPVK